jgi:hypothetical protein
MNQNATSKEQEKKKFSKGNNFELNKENKSVYDKALMLPDNASRLELFRRNSLEGYFKQLLKQNVIKEKENGKFSLFQGGNLWEFKNKNELYKGLAKYFKNDIEVDTAIQYKNYLMYKSNEKTRNDIVTSKNNILRNAQFIKKADATIQRLEREISNINKELLDSVYKNAMTQSKYTMSVHNATVNEWKMINQIDKNSLNANFRAVELLKNKLAADKRASELISARMREQNRNFKNKVDDINQKFRQHANDAKNAAREKANEDARRQFQEYNDTQNKLAAELAAKIAANAARIAAELKTAAEKEADAQREQDRKTRQELDKMKAIVDDINQDLKLTVAQTKKFEEDMKIAGINVTNSMPAACAGQPLPKGCSGQYWYADAKYTDAISKTTGKTGIKIYQCSAHGHFCASHGEGVGSWGELTVRFDNLHPSPSAFLR